MTTAHLTIDVASYQFDTVLDATLAEWSQPVPDQMESGRIWIIEGKAARGREDEIVQAKRAAAEEVIRKMTTHEKFRGKPYGYMVGYEDAISDSDSWAELRDRSSPVITRQYGR